MIYDYKVKDINGNEVSLSEYKGKVLLIVNTATDVDLLLNMRDYKSFMINIRIKALKYWISLQSVFPAGTR